MAVRLKPEDLNLPGVDQAELVRRYGPDWASEIAKFRESPGWELLRQERAQPVPCSPEMGSGRARRWEVIIPGWHPLGLNVMLRMHWRNRNRRLKADYNLIAYYCREAGVTTATGKRRITQRRILAGRDKMLDDDNCHKGLLDGLTRFGAIIDDTTQWLERAPIEFDRAAQRATIIVIEDV